MENGAIRVPAEHAENLAPSVPGLFDASVRVLHSLSLQLIEQPAQLKLDLQIRGLRCMEMHLQSTEIFAQRKPSRLLQAGVFHTSMIPLHIAAVSAAWARELSRIEMFMEAWGYGVAHGNREDNDDDDRW